MSATCWVGCSSSNSSQIQIESAAAAVPYSAVTLNYRVDAGRRGLPLHLAQPVGQQVSFQQSASSPYPGRSMGTLSIQYPHPDGRPEHALAELIIEDNPASPDATRAERGWKGWLGNVRRAARDNLPGIKLDDGVREAWAMDIPRADLDPVLARLSGTGYFTPTVMAPQGVQLATKIDGAKFNKTWVQVPELDGLAQRIRQQGRLVSYLRPQGQADPFAEPAMMMPYVGMVTQPPMAQSPMIRPPAAPQTYPLVPVRPGQPWMFAQTASQNPANVQRPSAGIPQMPRGMPGNMPTMATNPFAAPAPPVMPYSALPQPNPGLPYAVAARNEYRQFQYAPPRNPSGPPGPQRMVLPASPRSNLAQPYVLPSTGRGDSVMTYPVPVTDSSW